MPFHCHKGCYHVERNEKALANWQRPKGLLQQHQVYYNLGPEVSSLASQLRPEQPSSLLSILGDKHCKIGQVTEHSCDAAAAPMSTEKLVHLIDLLHTCAVQPNV